MRSVPVTEVHSCPFRSIPVCKRTRLKPPSSDQNRRAGSHHKLIKLIIFSQKKNCDSIYCDYSTYPNLGVQQYTRKPRFTLNKYCISIHFWLYKYTSLPYVSSSQFSSKICKKISIIAFIGFEIARKIGFSKP